MANEINIDFRLLVNKDNIYESLQRSFLFNMATAKGPVPGFQTIGSSYEVIAQVADVGTPGLFYAENMSSSVAVQIGVVVSSTFYALPKLYPKDGSGVPFCLFGLDPSATVYGKAASGSVDIKAMLFAL